jgi:hypothetical protein
VPPHAEHLTSVSLSMSLDFLNQFTPKTRKKIIANVSPLATAHNTLTALGQNKFNASVLNREPAGHHDSWYWRAYTRFTTLNGR